MTDRIGQKLGHYRLLRLLGQGGFADVYLAEHVHLETRVAVKVLSMRLSGELVEQFRTEARTVARLVHPHIVRVLDFGVEDSIPYLVMDYAPHGSLRTQHPKGTRLPLVTIVSYVKQLASALQYAHDAKLIHRDIKPENMLLGEQNQLLLSDFGIALMAQSTHYQNIQDVTGTVAYMAPEQLQGKPRRASDQYALGIVVYEWLSGERPFHGSFTEIYSQQLFVPPPSLREKMPTLHPDIETVVSVALAKEPSQRFASVQAFATALEQACQQSFAQQDTFRPTIELPELHASPKQTVIATPSTPLPNITNAVTPTSFPLPAPTTNALGQTSSILLPTNREHLSSGKVPSSASRLTLQIICGFLVALLLLGGALVWLTRSHAFSGSVAHVITTTYALVPTATLTPSLMLTATATPSPMPKPTATARSSSILTATATPTPLSTATATATPLPTATPTATPLPTATATATPLPTPTPTQQIVVQPTLTTDCAHLVTPWVALYQYPHFGGRELCFEGKGIINLAAYGFDKQTSSINIAANGVFFDQSNGDGTQLGFYYGDEQSDLGNWDSRISSFRVDS